LLLSSQLLISQRLTFIIMGTSSEVRDSPKTRAKSDILGMWASCYSHYFFNDVMHVFVILFNAGTDNEGIYSMRVGDRDTILMFTKEDDAARFGLMLEAQDFPPATVEAFDSEEIEMFCEEAGYEAKLIEEGMLAIPPEITVDETDWHVDKQPQSPEADGEFSDTELDKIRNRLEGLL